MSGVIHRVAHLVSRFIGQLDRRPPSAADEAWADAYLSKGERSLWVRLGNGDRRHAIGVARRALSIHPNSTRAEIAGSLLHDIGKVDAPRSALVRVWYVVSPSRNAQRYRDHEAVGADLLRSVGSDPVTVQLVAGEGPRESRDALRQADDSAGLRDRS